MNKAPPYMGRMNKVNTHMVYVARKNACIKKLYRNYTVRVLSLHIQLNLFKGDVFVTAAFIRA